MVLASNASNFDVIGIGNHEFDNGQPVLAELASMSSQPLICSNLARGLRTSKYESKHKFC